jgi:hypothetical protein
VGDAFVHLPRRAFEDADDTGRIELRLLDEEERAGLPGVERASVTSLFTPNVRFIEVVEDGFAGGNVIPTPEAGGEGMVVKPTAGILRGPHGLVQPGIKCRGREYLRIIYGPEYLEPANLARLRDRSLGRKTNLARQEFALGIEALDRFVAGEHLARVHECVFGVLALESEPVDPRL